MREDCLRCKEHEVNNQARGLCSGCYRYLWYRKELDLYPIRAGLWFNKQDKQMIADFKDLLKVSDMSLNVIAKKYGFTREYARQLFEKIFGFKFTVIKNQRTELRKRKREEAIAVKRDPRNKVARYQGRKDDFVYKGILAEKRVFEICETLGYKISPFGSRTVDLVINDYKVEVKSAYKTTYTASPSKQKTPSYHFALSESQSIVDFIICCAVPDNRFFIIPKEVFPKGNCLYICSKKECHWRNGKRISQSKHWEYLEAWHLLKPKEEIIFTQQPAQAALAN